MSFSSALRVTNKRLSDETPTNHTGPRARATSSAPAAGPWNPTQGPSILAAGDEEAAVGAEGEGKYLARVPGELLGLGRACVAEIQDLHPSTPSAERHQRWSRLKLDSITVARRN
jgi:hypothetical protein